MSRTDKWNECVLCAEPYRMVFHHQPLAWPLKHRATIAQRRMLCVCISVYATVSQATKPTISNKLMTNEDVQMYSQLEQFFVKRVEMKSFICLFFSGLIFQMSENNFNRHHSVGWSNTRRPDKSTLR